MENEAQQFQYLWDGSQPHWGLLNVGDSGDKKYLIVNLESKAAKIIENDSVAEQVIEQMLLAGMKVVTPGQGF